MLQCGGLHGSTWLVVTKIGVRLGTNNIQSYWDQVESSSTAAGLWSVPICLIHNWKNNFFFSVFSTAAACLLVVHHATLSELSCMTELQAKFTIRYIGVEVF